MRLVPRSLAARTFALVATIVLVCEALTFAVAGYYRNAFLMQRGVELVASYIRLARFAIESLPAERRAAGLAEVIGDRGVRVVPGPAAGRYDAFEPRFLRHLHESLSHALGPDARVRSLHTDAGTEFWIEFRAAGAPWSLVVPTARFERPLPWGLIAALGLLVALLLGLAAIFVRGITRPLAQLADAAAAVGAGAPRRAPVAGPREVQGVANAFNAMLTKLEESDRTRRVMLAGLPHDLRAPLARLKLRLSMLDAPGAAEGLRQDAIDIERIADRFIEYLRTLDARTADHVELDLGALVSERVARYEGIGRRVIAAPLESAHLRADPEALVRLVDNLIDNALQHVAEPVEVGVATAADAIVLTVRDHGPGIALEARARALEPFTQLEESRGTRGGTGLGLAIVSEIVRAHRGTIRLDAATGGGLQVEVRLPVA